MDYTALTFAILYGFGLNIAGGLLTDLSEWYHNLEKPWFQPPGWAFGPAWTIILGLAGWALYIGLTEAESAAQYYTVAAAFSINAVFHFLWSPLFFKFKRPDWSFYENWALIASCIALAFVLDPVSSFAAWLVLPYILWTCFAQAINFKVVRLNGPFGSRAEEA
ncbi:TspO protein [Erythrobacter sp. KY5]|uniref:TspO/MBR family protein n=1 Tax=Erythrobacter sp. KY5 TaxID=2011159 RepID=UPI000DBEFFBD|nr:TspO/MBR family protein [Erythrobacter sp. KY5]AWW74732.1 TspO protein [Erythrobacter sp. KY5]